MAKQRKQRKTGMLPGTLVHTGNKKMESTEMTLIHFDEEAQSKKAYRHGDTAQSNWINKE